MKPNTRPIVIKKKVAHAAHHGGAWKVAYADFVTAMMALFIVLWLLSQTDQETRQQLSEYFRTGMFSGAPSVMMGGSGINERAFLDVADQTQEQSEQTTLEQAAADVRAAALSTARQLGISGLDESVRIKVVNDGLLIQIVDGGDDLLFDLSSAKLKPGLVSLLERLGPVLGKLPNTIQVRGHTDARPFPNGSERNNWQLSFQRADNARAVLEKHGLAPGQIAGVFAHGATAPIDPKHPLSAQNRRLTILAVRAGNDSHVARGAPSKPITLDKLTPARPH